MARFGSLDAQYFDDAGDPLISGLIYFYESGTSTLKTTYSDVNLTIANTNPVVLTAAGRQPNVFFDGVAKAILATSANVQILVRDPVGETTSAFGDAWISSKIYAANEVVQGTDGEFYVSLVGSNVNQNPVSTSGYWVLLYSVEWNAGITYTEGAVVTVSNILYQSLQNTNLNHNPTSSPTYWVVISLAYVSTITYTVGQNVVGSNGVFYTALRTTIGDEPSISTSDWVGTSAAAAASATAALASQVAAAASATSATASATSATTSATTATTQAGISTAQAVISTAQAVIATTQASNASTSATNAAASAATASTQASNSSTSATASAASATASAASAATATTQASNASTSASNAATSETNSAASAATATTQAGISTAQAVISTAQAVISTAQATTATTQASNASTSAASALTYLNTFKGQYYGALATDPTVDPLGAPMTAGDLYWNSTSSEMRVYSGAVWAAAYLPASGYATSGANSNITSLSGLTTPLSIAQGGTGSASTAYASLTANVTGTLPAANGGTGVANNAAMTVTGSGNFAYTRTLTGTTNVTLPTTGTLATLAGTETFTNKTLTSPTLTTPVLGTPTSGTLSACTVDGTNLVGFKSVPAVGTKTASYTLAVGDVGKYVQLGASGAIVIPDATFAEGNAITLFNNTASTATITCSITTAYIAGTFTDKATMTLAAAGVATILFISGTTCVVAGNVT
jgi:hypothetical protein